MEQRKLSDIQTGDLLVWDKAYGADAGSLWMNIVRFMTVSNYGHVSIAVTTDTGLCHVEAVLPRIQVEPIREDAEFYVIPMSKVINDPNNIDFLMSTVGLRYGWIDALAAYFGFTLKADDRWQCAELCQEFFSLKGLDLGIKHPTPTRVVKAALSVNPFGMYRVNAKK